MLADSTIRIPTATYRLQFNHSFTFARARALVPYFHALGISDCYASSFLRAMPGSMHGYDVIDPTTLNGEIGSEQEFAAMTETIRTHSMGLILDVVDDVQDKSHGMRSDGLCHRCKLLFRSDLAVQGGGVDHVVSVHASRHRTQERRGITITDPQRMKIWHQCARTSERKRVVELQTIRGSGDSYGRVGKHERVGSGQAWDHRRADGIVSRQYDES